jgi:hypothetical protein
VVKKTYLPRDKQAREETCSRGQRGAEGAGRRSTDRGQTSLRDTVMDTEGHTRVRHSETGKRQE